MAGKSSEKAGRLRWNLEKEESIENEHIERVTTLSLLRKVRIRKRLEGGCSKETW